MNSFAISGERSASPGNALKISEIFAKKLPRKEPVFSFEFFPPKTEKGEKALYQAIDELKPLNPDFVSVTYGAGGSTRARTLDWVTAIKNGHGVEAMAHLTCVGATREDLEEFISQLKSRGLHNVLALRGDPPRDQTAFRPTPGGFSYANELVEFIKERQPDLSVGVAGYPEKHVEAVDFETDLYHLINKTHAGADFVITQLFFDNSNFYSFLDKLRSFRVSPAGAHALPDWNTPVVPGIMPITSASQLDKFIAMCGAIIPPDLRARIERAKSDEEVAEIGIEHATEQVRDLIEKGAPGIHFYTLNKSTATRKILKSIRAERT